MSKLPVTFLLTLVLGVDGAASSRLLDYELRVVQAAEQIDRIRSDREQGEEGINNLRQWLPRSEEIEYQGSKIVIDNSWLHEILDSYVAEKDPQQRLARLNEAGGRLRALDDHLRRAVATESGDVAAQRDKIREILSRPAYQPEPQTLVGAFVKKVLRKVRGFISEIYSALTRLLEKVLGASANSGWVSNLLLIAVLAAALVVAVRLGRRIRRPQRNRKRTRLVLGEEVSVDATSGELAEAGLAAARAGDFRTAVRKLYVSLLYELVERNLVELEESATNHEYLSKASRFSGLAGPMRYLTDRFDYVWYGMFPSSADDFAAYYARYEEAMKRARALGEQAASAS